MAISAGPDIIQEGLVLALDAADRNSYVSGSTTWFDLSGNRNHFTLFNQVGYSTTNGGSLTFDGTNDYAASNNNLNLSIYDYVIVDVFVKPNVTSSGMVFEHTTNWNTQAGGFGLSINSNGNTSQFELHHTNHNIGGVFARNYIISGSLNWNNHINQFSKISDSTGRLTYGNSNLLSFSSVGGFPTGTTTSVSSFANAIWYIGSRAGTTAYFNGSIGSLKIYGFKINQAQILQNYTQLKSRFNL